MYNDIVSVYSCALQDWSEMSEADGDLSSMPTCDVCPAWFEYSFNQYSGYS